MLEFTNSSDGETILVAPQQVDAFTRSASGRVLVRMAGGACFEVRESMDEAHLKWRRAAGALGLMRRGR